VELLKQPQYSPFPVEEQVVSIWLGTSGKLDDVPVADIGKFESEFLDHVRRNEDGAFAEIRDTGKLSDENVERLEGVVKDFKRGFTTSSGESLVNEAPVDAMNEEDVDQETVKVRKKD
jgi:F-type H+/Na+-transporting ATPase subunit alpha